MYLDRSGGLQDSVWNAGSHERWGGLVMSIRQRALARMLGELGIPGLRVTDAKFQTARGRFKGILVEAARIEYRRVWVMGNSGTWVTAPVTAEGGMFFEDVRDTGVPTSGVVYAVGAAVIGELLWSIEHLIVYDLANFSEWRIYQESCLRYLTTTIRLAVSGPYAHEAARQADTELRNHLINQQKILTAFEKAHGAHQEEDDDDDDEYDEYDEYDQYEEPESTTASDEGTEQFASHVYALLQAGIGLISPAHLSMSLDHEPMRVNEYIIVASIGGALQFNLEFAPDRSLDLGLVIYDFGYEDNLFEISRPGGEAGEVASAFLIFMLQTLIALWEGTVVDAGLPEDLTLDRSFPRTRPIDALTALREIIRECAYFLTRLADLDEGEIARVANHEGDADSWIALVLPPGRESIRDHALTVLK